MKKFFASIFITSLLIVSLSSTVIAQDQDYDYARAYQDYVFTQDVYTGKLSEYRLARSQYLQAQTLVSESKAKDATVAFLESRDDVIISYLVAVRYRLNEAVGVGNAIKSSLSSRIDSEIAWFRDHRNRISSAGTLEDLIQDSDEATDRFAESEKVIYEALIEISAGKVEVLRSSLTNNLSDFRNVVSKIELNGDYDVSFAQRWFEEINQKITRSLDKVIESKTYIAEIYDTKGSRNSGTRSASYNTALSKINESYFLLRDGNNFMKEVMRGVKPE